MPFEPQLLCSETETSDDAQGKDPRQLLLLLRGAARLLLEACQGCLGLQCLCVAVQEPSAAQHPRPQPDGCAALAAEAIRHLQPVRAFAAHASMVEGAAPSTKQVPVKITVATPAGATAANVRVGHVENNWNACNGRGSTSRCTRVLLA